ncbi:Leukotoxin [Planktothrix tepida]|uniref:Polymorphic outer membrane protein n=1 Tax=Planktothrix tepida PCC 9214 TaxID=671072 RepID=A0A1J1LMP3_9CYAN|nr:calcium-binding protein [Planktothrix tepida]CAD5944578.1 Leukotoxin [Planktothrix tepida]CUR32881.1 Polymorphic outer membrane protein [Planktothrix tepida PCC 9214]
MANLIVTNLNDNGIGSLREAIAQAQSGDIIQFDSSLANQQNSIIKLTTGQLNIDKSITIDGLISGTIPTPVTISGENQFRVLELQVDQQFQPTNITLKNLIIINGNATGIDEAGAGGGIRMGGSTNLTLENSELNDNVAQFGGGIYTGFKSNTVVINSKFNHNDGTLGGSERGGGAIATKSAGSLTVKDSEFTNNKGINGGAINHLLGNLTIDNSKFINNTSVPGGTVPNGSNNYHGAGGAIYTDGANASGANFEPGLTGGIIQISNSLFDGNTGAGQGGGLFLFAYPPDQIIVENSTIINNIIQTNLKGDSLGGGLRSGNAELTINHTTFANNRAYSQGGGLWIGETSPTTITNSTFSGNRAESSDGNQGLGGAITLANGTNSTQIINTTIANNYAGFQGGGFWGGGTNVTLQNTILAKNFANNGGNSWNVKHHTGTEYNEGGGNIQTNELNPNDTKATANIQLVADALLGDLQTIDGKLIHPLLIGSPAIDTGNNNNSPITDQLGQTRPIDGDQNGTAIIDSGAYEFPVLTPTPTPTVTPTPTPTPSPTLTVTPTPTPTPTITPTPTPTPSPTPTVTPSPTPTSSPTVTPSPTPTPTPTPIPQPTPTPTPSPTPTPTPQPTQSPIVGENDCLCDQFPKPNLNPEKTQNVIEKNLNGTIENDDLRGSNFNDQINGFEGNDTLIGMESADNLNGGNGNDLLLGNQGADVFMGGLGDDTQYGGQDDDILQGDENNDLLFGDRNHDLIQGNLGEDTLYGGKENDQLQGDEGDDILYGDLGNDTLIGGSENDILLGNLDDDLLDGGSGDDSLLGGENQDSLEGGIGNDSLWGDLGNDSLCGGDNNDLLLGNSGVDIIDGCLGNDSLYGGSENDSLIGGIGNDSLWGDLGDDTLNGGLGQDIFMLQMNAGNDLILDFDITLDQLGLSNGLTFEQLTLIQEENAVIIRLTSTEEDLAKLNGIDLDLITANQFQVI